MSLVGPNSEGCLAEVIGHELRNPLAAVVASVCVSLEMTDADDPRSTFLSQAVEDLSRISTLLSSYLDLGRARNLRHQKVDLVDVVRRVCGRFRNRLATVSHEAGNSPVPLRGDPTLLERLLENLVENALSMGAKHVDLHLERHCDECILQVTDDGPGVPAELRDTLFDPFVSGREGSGLGLALAKDIVESHAGTITLVPSEVGAVFRVSLPAA